MTHRTLWLGSLLAVGVLAATTLVAAKPDAPNDLIVHEWGTFLAMNGSDGAILDGMYHEEHALPAFVHARSKDQLRLPSALLKGETPVIYFYTKRRQNVSVRVKFPEGIWTQWYPQANLVSPSTTQSATPPELRNGHICWNVEVLPPDTVQAPSLPQTASDALWNYARQVDAAYVRTTDRTRGPTANPPSEYERFVFYRGLGHAPLPVQMTSFGDGTLSYSGQETYPIRHVFVLRVEKGRGVYKYIASLAPGASVRQAIPDMKEALPLPEFTRKIADDLADKLIESGLYPKEARAMVNTWSASYFQNDGVRVLFVLPQEWTDRFIPMELSPQPQQIVRVMVGRLELLTPERERQAEIAVGNLASPNATTRDNAFAYLRDQGRYVEPIIRRVQRTTDNKAVRTLCKRLLLTDYVTELRAAVHNAATGRLQTGEGQRTDDPRFARAQLAALLREIGLTAQAQAEGRAVYADLRRIKAPPFQSPEFRPYSRAYARTMEALGDNRGAAAWYEKFVRFGSQAKTCSGCHTLQGPRDMTFFRDWWAGKKYAQYTARVMPSAEAISRLQAALNRRPNDTASQLLLAYLYTAKGDTARAARMWADVEMPLSRRTALAR